MDLIQDWSKIRRHFSKSFRSSLHVAIASVDVENSPTVTPIGSLFINEDQTGFYFEKFPSKLPENQKANLNICVLGVNSNRWLWIKALYKLRFSTYPALKLYGTLGNRREATEKELYCLQRRMRMTRFTKGHKYLWQDMKFVRELKFTKVEVINLAQMTHHL